MLKKLSVVALAAVVAAGVAVSGCAKKADPKAAEELCKMTGQASVEYAKSMHPQAPEAKLKELAEMGTKACVDKINALGEEEKKAAYKQAADMLKKCSAKKGKEFLDCTGASN